MSRAYAADSLVVPGEDEDVCVVNLVVTKVTRGADGSLADAGGGACLSVCTDESVGHGVCCTVSGMATAIELGPVEAVVCGPGESSAVDTVVCDG